MRYSAAIGASAGGLAAIGALLENLPVGLGVSDGQGRLVPRVSVLERITEADSADLATWRIVPTAGDELERGAPP